MRPEDRPPMGRSDLDAMSSCEACEGPRRDHEALALHARCHPQSPTWTFYAGDGILVVRCAKCDQMIAAIWVGEAPPS
jgi:hypothetical protein